MTAPEWSVPGSESTIARLCSWAALLAAFVLSWTTWVGIGDIAEYGFYKYALPVCVDGYIVTVLMAWIAPRDSRAAANAKRNVYVSAGLSILTQSVYHGCLVYSHTETAWKAGIAWLAGALPPLFAALSVHFRTGVRTQTGTDTIDTVTHEPELAELRRHVGNLQDTLRAEADRRGGIQQELIEINASQRAIERELERKGPPVAGYAAERVTSFPTTDDHPRAESTYPVSCGPGSALTTDSSTLSANGPAKTGTVEEKTAWVREWLVAGEEVTGAMADREFPGSPRNGARIVRTVKQELENEPKLRSIAAGER